MALRESQGVAKASRAAEAASSSLDARLARATEEAERARAQLQAERAEAAERERDLRAKCETLGAQAKRAERQRGELLAAFKKQLRLIDVLKRQRIHVRRCCFCGWGRALLADKLPLLLFLFSRRWRRQGCCPSPRRSLCVRCLQQQLRRLRLVLCRERQFHEDLSL